MKSNSYRIQYNGKYFQLQQRYDFWIFFYWKTIKYSKEYIPDWEDYGNV